MYEDNITKVKRGKKQSKVMQDLYSIYEVVSIT